MFADANLSFLSNFLNECFGIKYKSSDYDSHVYPLIKAPQKFEDLDISSLFLINTGTFILMILLIYLLYGSLQLIVFFQKNTKKKTRFNEITLKINKYFTHPLIIRLQSVFFLTICLATCLQFRSFSTLDSEYFYNYLCAFFSLIYIIIFMILMFKVSNNEKTFFHDVEYLGYYSALFQSSNMDLFVGRNHFLLICSKKIFLALVVVSLYDWFYVEIAIVICEQIFEIFLAFKYNFYTVKMMNYFLRFSDIMFLFSLLVFLIMQIYFDLVINQLKEIPENIVNNFFALGWIFIALLFSVMGLFFILVNWSMLKMIHSSIKRFKAHMKRKREFFQLEKNHFDDSSNSSSKQNSSKLVEVVS